MESTPTLDWSFVLDRWPLLGQGLLLDLYMAVVGTLAACAIGLALQRARASKAGIVSKSAYAFIQVTMGVPFYALLLWLYAGVSSITVVEISAINCTILALALADCGKTAEIFRGGFDAIDAGQFEAADALGLTAWDRYVHILLPQVARVTIAPLGNIFIGQIKGATVAAVIAVPEMVFYAQDLSVTYFRPFEAFGTVAAVLVVVVLAFSLALNLVEDALRLP